MRKPLFRALRNKCTGILFCLLSLSAFSQVEIKGKIIGRDSGAPLSYCSIALKGTPKGTITNAEGKFQLYTDTAEDTLIISYLGYHRRHVAASYFLKNKTLALNVREENLEAFTVYSDNEFLYDLLKKCRKFLRSYDREQVTRAYYTLETQTSEKPLELLECYYNAYLEGINTNNLAFKNGRMGLSAMGDRYFLNFSTSVALRKLCLTRKDRLFPGLPLQYSKWRMKRLFDLHLINVEGNLFHLGFSPLGDEHSLFSGELWIDKNDHSLRKIILRGEDLKTIPFQALAPSDSIGDFSLEISQTYKNKKDQYRPGHIRFKYSMKYKSVRDTLPFRTEPVLTREISSKGLLYYYDAGDPFILPFYSYSDNMDGYGDYVKMTMIPFNEVFWNNNNELLLSEERQSKLGFMADYGKLINFHEISEKERKRRARLTPHEFEDNTIFWSAGKRLAMKHSFKNKEMLSMEEVNSSIRSDLYRIKTQIILDVNRLQDSLHCQSYTAFDVWNSYYRIPEEKYTNVFLNLYFDLCEIERRKMEKKLAAGGKTLEEIRRIYSQTNESMEQVTEKYVDETESGTNEFQLRKWNDYVKEELGIDNIKMFFSDKKE